jgi:hypothetical protein
VNTRTTAILAILLAILLGAYYFTEVRGVRKDPDEAKRLFTAKPEDVEALELHAGGTDIRLQRQDGGWRVEQPIQAKGDAAAIGALAASLVGARAERTLEELPKSLADFGLDNPDLIVRFRARGDSQWRRLEFGGKNPTGAWAYVRVDEKPQVILVADTLRAELRRPVLDLRDKSVMDVEAERVTRLVVQRGAQEPLELQRGAQWEIVKPVKARADEWRVSGLVRRLAAAKAKAFAAEPATDLKRYGLDRPAVRLELWEKDAAAPKVLALAEPKDKPDLLYGRNEGTMTVVELDKALVTDVPKDAWEIRDKSLFRYANKDVKKVRLAWGGAALAVEREGEAKWKVAEPAAGAADESRVTDLLFKLTALRADGVAAEHAGTPDRYGLDRPELTITVTGADGKPLGALLLGKEERAERYVQIQGEPAVYTIPSKDLKDLPRAPEDLREKKAEKKA